MTTDSRGCVGVHLNGDERRPNNGINRTRLSKALKH